MQYMDERNSGDLEGKKLKANQELHCSVRIES